MAVRMVAFLALALAVAQAGAARITQVSPQGEVAEVRQVVVRFDAAVVPAGDPRGTAPLLLQCAGKAPPGDGRWNNDRTWVFDLREPLAAGTACLLSPNAAFKPLGGAALEGARDFAFSTGAPAVVSVQPYPGARIDEDQHFLLRLNGAVNPASVLASAWCEVEGLGERIAVKIVEGPPREQVLRRRVPPAAQPNTLLLACQRAFAPEARVRLVWGEGIAAAGNAALVVKRAQRFQWQVRPRFLAEFTCERENARSPCLPLRPMTLRFNAPVPRALALGARLVAADGKAIEPKAEGSDDQRAETISAVRFAAPLPENTRLQLTLPAALRDDAGRALGNAGTFPLAVATGGLPPLAKFAGAPFGIVEAGPDAMMPMTLRHVQADIAGASTGGRVAVRRLDANTADAELLRWLGRLQKDNDEQWKTRATSLLAGDAAARKADLPQLTGPQQPGATEVVGVPLRERGYHVIEVESRVLGNALLESRGPMYARTGALVTNLAVHFKRGRDSSLVWVTTLDRGRPVASARVAVNDCQGRPLWNGSTDANGIARIERGFDDERYHERCLTRDGLFVTARANDGQADGKTDDLAFVFSGWQRGIEPWRFEIPTAEGSTPDRIAHTVFDRTLLRAGETVSMKHYLRDATVRGLALPGADTLPTEVLLRHAGSDSETRLPLAWPAGARAAESSWAIPKNAKLGLYDVVLVRGERRLPSGSFRVEAFRVPLLDARLAAPAGVQVAPAELAFSAQINAMAGGPVAAAPLKLSALLRPASVQFTGYEDFGFEPPRRDRDHERDPDREGGSDRDDPSRIVADKLPATTNAQGAARIVLPKLPPLAAPSDLQAELSFDDPNGEVQTVAQRLRLWPAALVVGLRVPGWAASRGELGATAVVLSTDGRPLAGREVVISGRVQQQLSTRKRIVGGFYAYDNQRSVRELGTLCSGKTDAQGRITCNLKLDAAGEVELVARAKDDAGRSSEAATSVWLSQRGGEWWFGQDNDDRIDILPEQRELEPGQTARLQVRMPFRQATALVTVEREGVIDARVMTLSGRQPVIELPVPADRAWAPNVVVNVLVLRGRLRQAPWWSLFTWGWREPGEWWRAFRYEGEDWRAPTAMVDLAKPTFKLGAAQLKIGLAAQRLDVSVKPEKAQYQTRQTVNTLVTVSHGGKPAANAEIAFAAVDEGLLALQDNASWKLLEALMRSRPWGVETATAQGEIVGRRHYGRKALPPGGGGGRNPTRELFDTLLLWRGTVKLDAQGQARIAVPLNDSLTSFRLVAVADDGGQRFGAGSASVSVSQDLQLLSGLPPLAREGDTLDAVFTLRNTTARAMNVKATLAGPGNALPPQTVPLAAGAAATVRWTLQVPAGAERIDWEAAAEETGSANPARDRVKVAQAVQPAVPVRTWQALLAPVDAATPLSWTVQPPADALPASARLDAIWLPRLTGSLPGVRRFFETYPYHCLEQETSRAIGLADTALQARLRDELPAYLDSDGLANYFVPAPGSAARGSDRLTAYLISAAQEAGMNWPDAARDAMLQGLAAFVEGRIERRFFAPRQDLAVRKLAALDALSRWGRVQPRMLGSIEWTPAVWPTSALLDAWGLVQRTPALPDRAARLDELQRLVKSRLTVAGTTLKFSTEDSDDWWWLMDGPDANALRLLLLASDAPAWKDELPQLLTGALARQRRGAWTTTTANTWGVLALQRFAAKFESVPVAGRGTVSLGSVVRSADVAASAAVTLPLPAGISTLQARHEGAGRPWLSARVLAAVPLTAPLAAGFRITRTLVAVERKQPDAWSRGDIVRVRLEVDAVADMGWVVVSDPVPAGAAILGSGLGRDSAIAARDEKREGRGWLAYEERAADAWRAYYEWLPRGRHVLEYTVRLNSAGRLQLPPTRAEAMYAPEVFGELPNAVLEVRP